MSGQIANPANEIVLTARRRWSSEEKQALLTELVASGLSVSEFARRRGVARDLLFRWRREERDRIASEAPGFIPLSLPAPRGGADGGIEVVLASGVRVIVGERANLALLRRVIAALS
jgi:transposase